MSTSSSRPLGYRWAKIVALLLVFIAMIVGGDILFLLATNNFHVVVPGEMYRSGQMNTNALAKIIRAHGIRCVVNLRGSGPADWYIAETNLTCQLQVEHLDFELSASQVVSDHEIDQILSTLRRAPKPFLIHCNGGADRSALISALYRYAIAGETAVAASHELSPFYGHLPYFHWRATMAMDDSYWRYVNQPRHHTEPPNPGNGRAGQGTTL